MEVRGSPNRIKELRLEVIMTIPYFARLSAAEKSERRGAVQKRYREKHRDQLLAKKRAYVRQPHVLARRRYAYLHRNDPKPCALADAPMDALADALTDASPPPLSLDLWARHNPTDHDRRKRGM